MLMSILKSKSNGDQNKNVNPLEVFDFIETLVNKTMQAEAPNFAQFSKKINLGLNVLFKLANLKKATFPKMQASLKFMGKINFD